MSFWSNKPLEVNNNINYILDSNALLSKINNEINCSKIILDYHVIVSPDNLLKCKILEFINNNYIGNDSNFTLNYSLPLFNYYITKDTVCILFYPHNKKPQDINTQNMVGFICGRPETIYIKDVNTFKEYNTIDVNYLCLIKQLRNLHVSSYIINILTKQCILKFNKKINCALYTIGGKSIKTPSFSNKTFYHIPLNIENLTNSKLINLDKDISILKNMFGKFNIDKEFLKGCEFIPLTKEYLTQNPNILNNTVNKLYDKLNNINKINYDIFDYKSKVDIKNILLNSSFYNFIIINSETNDIKDYICLYNLDTKNINNDIVSRNGYFYMFMSLGDDNYKFNLIEYISKYCYLNNLFDMLTLMDIMEKGYLTDKHYKILNSSTKLYYYMYNLRLKEIQPFKNGLITI